MKREVRLKPDTTCAMAIVVAYAMAIVVSGFSRTSMAGSAP
jgi:hypothetical protein